MDARTHTPPNQKITRQHLEDAPSPSLVNTRFFLFVVNIVLLSSLRYKKHTTVLCLLQYCTRYKTKHHICY